MPKPATEQEFQKYLQNGFVRVTPEELMDQKKGGFLRYAIDTIENGHVHHTYGCGNLATVDPYFDTVTLVWGKRVWKIKLSDRSRVVRLYYREKLGRAEEEIAVFRKLLEQIENGEIEIVSKK